MKKIKSILFLVCSFLILVSCSSSSDSEDPDDPNPTADLIIGNWKLIGYKEPSGAITSVEPCIKVFNKFESNAAFMLTSDDCGDMVSFSGT
jgi:PBP1b-binding outer membrane lipoprotein LpoB